LLATLFALAFFGGTMLLHLFGVEKMNVDVLFASRILFWSPLLVIFFYARKVEKQKLLIWEERKLAWWEYIISFIAIYVTLVIGVIIIGLILYMLGLQKESDKFVKMLAIFREHQWLIFVTSFTAGVVEELTFRGYLLPRLHALVKSPAVAILLSSVLFGLVHFGYGTIVQVVAPFFIGFVFALYYYKFRNIKILIVCHILWDIMAIYLKLFAESLKDGKL
jgi:membrane protease YdiL (CAAX protease family)